MASTNPKKGHHQEGLQKFIGVYILTSMAPSFKNHTYVGYTNDPGRRVRQHNGELKGGGAKRTSRKRPWELVLVLYGFPTDRQALRFEWALQNPHKTRALDCSLKGTAAGNVWLLRAKVRFLYELLWAPAFRRLPLTVHWFSDKRHHLLSGCPLPPLHHRVSILPLALFTKF